jgi:SAM-dependent methyltransferase
VAAGPADHGLEFARRGIEAHVLDAEMAMLDFASLRAASSGLNLTTHCSDMMSFNLPKRFDLVILMLDSISHVYTLDAFVEHLQSVRRHLKKTGTYIIEIAHPSSFLGGKSANPTWVVPATRLGKISVAWGTAQNGIDSLSQIEMISVKIVAIHGNKRVVVRQTVSQRRWTYTETIAAIRLSGVFRVAESHGSFGADSPLDSRRKSWRMIHVLRPS